MKLLEMLLDELFASQRVTLAFHRVEVIPVGKNLTDFSPEDFADFLPPGSLFVLLVAGIEVDDVQEVDVVMGQNQRVAVE